MGLKHQASGCFGVDEPVTKKPKTIPLSLTLHTHTLVFHSEFRKSDLAASSSRLPIAAGAFLFFFPPASWRSITFLRRSCDSLGINCGLKRHAGIAPHKPCRPLTSRRIQRMRVQEIGEPALRRREQGSRNAEKPGKGAPALGKREGNCNMLDVKREVLMKRKKEEASDGEFQRSATALTWS